MSLDFPLKYIYLNYLYYDLTLYKRNSFVLFQDGTAASILVAYKAVKLKL
jgi:hypothetical protein